MDTTDPSGSQSGPPGEMEEGELESDAEPSTTPVTQPPQQQSASELQQAADLSSE